MNHSYYRNAFSLLLQLLTTFVLLLFVKTTAKLSQFRVEAFGLSLSLFFFQLSTTENQRNKRRQRKQDILYVSRQAQQDKTSASTRFDISYTRALPPFYRMDTTKTAKVIEGAPVRVAVDNGNEVQQQQFSPRNCFSLGIFVVFMTAICIVILAVVIVIPVMNKFS